MAFQAHHIRLCAAYTYLALLIEAALAAMQNIPDPIFRWAKDSKRHLRAL